jgi:hypothetical protein
MHKSRPTNEADTPSEGSGNLTSEIEKYFERFGPLMQGRDVWRALGYPTQSAFAMARRRGTVPIKLYLVPERRGVFAYTEDVARWVSSVRQLPAAPKPEERDQR